MLWSENHVALTCAWLQLAAQEAWIGSVELSLTSGLQLCSKHGVRKDSLFLLQEWLRSREGEPYAVKHCFPIADFSKDSACMLAELRLIRAHYSHLCLPEEVLLPAEHGRRRWWDFNLPFPVRGHCQTQSVVLHLLWDKGENLLQDIMRNGG